MQTVFSADHQAVKPTEGDVFGVISLVFWSITLIVSIETTGAPYVPESERLVVDNLGYEDDGISHLTARFGFQDTPDVPRLLALAAETGLETEVDVEGAVYFLSQVSVAPTSAPCMAGWRRRLFVAMSRNAATPVDYFRLPGERTVTLGSRIEL